jgi:uncharacterized CHY-type Zn-finger protein
MADIEQNLRDQVRGLSVTQLGAALDWHTALAEHADENFRHADYHREKLIADICREELATRAQPGGLHHADR